MTLRGRKSSREGVKAWKHLLNDGALIILTGSAVWQKGMPMYATYAATKAALRSYVGNIDAAARKSVDPERFNRNFSVSVLTAMVLRNSVA